jgi:molecular chaperone HscC
MIGIDLGTTNSLVAILDGGEPRTLANEFGEDLIPSAVAISEDGVILVGRAAKDRLIAVPDSGRAFFKRDMGTDATYHFGGRQWSPVECSAVVLREMKRIAEFHLGREVTSAVITVPAYFHDPQRQATIDAATLAGLKVERLLNEPTAAALAFGFRASSELSTLLVFDLGGGTFDVTVLEAFEGVVEVKASAGESRLGGEDYTDALDQRLRQKLGLELADGLRLRWREEVEKVKRRLTSEAKVVVELDDCRAEITREDFAEVTKALTGRLIPTVKKAMRDASLTPGHLDALLMVGGASRMPVVADVLQAQLGVRLLDNLDPDRVVALGAAVQQGLIAGDAAVRELVLTDVCPHTLGVAVARRLGRDQIEPGFFEPLIERNTMVPCSFTKSFFTFHPEQDEVLLQVFQGESRLVAANRLIGELRITGLKSMPGQRHPGAVDVRFSYDMNGLLEVDVTIVETGRRTSRVFEQRPGMLSPQQIEEALRILQPLKVLPRDQPQHRARIERANRLYCEMTGGLRDSLAGLVDAFESALHSQNPAAIRQAAEELDEFVKPFADS